MRNVLKILNAKRAAAFPAASKVRRQRDTPLSEGNCEKNA
jgi:hypothetical protein